MTDKSHVIEFGKGEAKCIIDLCIVAGIASHEGQTTLITTSGDTIHINETFATSRIKWLTALDEASGANGQGKK